MSEVQFLTTAAVAAKLGVAPRTVLVWAKRGKIPCERLTRRTIRFEFSAVLAAIRTNAKEARRGS
jgi:excisionase family DNA binding protein